MNSLGDENVYRAEIERLQRIIGKQAIQIEILKKNRGPIQDKMSAVASLRQFGYTIKDACQALGLARSGYYASTRPKNARASVLTMKDSGLIERIKVICGAHPFWCYRRVWAWLNHCEGIWVNQKWVRRVMKGNGLMVPQTIHKAKRTPTRRKPKADKPRQFWGIDMTRFMVNDLDWVYLVIVLDWWTKKLVGWNISLRSKTADWKQALDIALNKEFPEGVRGKGLKLISDNGCQPTSVSFMRDMADLGIEQIFTSYDNPKGNAETERMLRTVKEEVIGLNEFENLAEAKEKISKWIEINYNKLYFHNKLGYLRLGEFEALYRGD